MFSRKSGEAVAVIKQDEKPSGMLYVTEDKDDEVEVDYDNVDDDFYKAITSAKTKNKMMNVLLFTLSLKYVNLAHGQHFELMPPIEGSRRIVIAGMTGSGKSYQTALLIKKYHALHPNNSIFMFSQHTHDPVYDEIKYIKRVDISEENMLSSKLNIEVLHDSLCIFDDTDNIQNKKVSGELQMLINDINCNGRHHNISSIICLHQICNYQKTKSILADISGCMLFLNGSKYNINRFLKCYAGLDQKQIKSITSLKSRWFYISLVQPMYVLSEYKAFIIKD